MLVTGDEVIEIHGAEGLEVEIRLTAEGPILRLHAAQVQIEATESLTLRGKRVGIEATEAISLSSEGRLDLTAKADLDLRTEAELHATAEMIWLN